MAIGCCKIRLLVQDPCGLQARREKYGLRLVASASARTAGDFCRRVWRRSSSGWLSRSRVAIPQQSSSARPQQTHAQSARQWTSQGSRQRRGLGRRLTLDPEAVKRPAHCRRCLCWFVPAGILSGPFAVTQPRNVLSVRPARAGLKAFASSAAAGKPPGFVPCNRVPCRDPRSCNGSPPVAPAFHPTLRLLPQTAQSVTTSPAPPTASKTQLAWRWNVGRLSYRRRPFQRSPLAGRIVCFAA